MAQVANGEDCWVPLQGGRWREWPKRVAICGHPGESWVTETFKSVHRASRYAAFVAEPFPVTLVSSLQLSLFCIKVWHDKEREIGYETMKRWLWFCSAVSCQRLARYLSVCQGILRKARARARDRGKFLGLNLDGWNAPNDLRLRLDWAAF